MALADLRSEPASVAAARLLQIVEAKFGDGLKAARPPGAVGPGADARSLRLAYLDLLKLTLCDLAGTGTTSVTRTMTGDVMSRELEGDQLRFRAAGMDWPLHGMTMVGLARLDDLQRCVESVVADGVEGDVIEAGTWRGGASMLMRATLDTLGARERTVYVADSFQGFPQVQGEESGSYDLGADLAACDYLAVSLEEVTANFARLGLERGVEFVPGFFEETLHALAPRRWAIARLDGDTYDATRCSLEALYPNLSPGGYLVLDDYAQIEQCREAVHDFRREHGIIEPIEHVDWSGARWRRQSAPEPMTDARVPVVATPTSTTEPVTAVARKSPTRVPAIEEVELRHELEQVRGRLAAAEADVERLRASPLVGPSEWLRRRLGRGLSNRS
jgi:O-methyltransferase